MPCDAVRISRSDTISENRAQWLSPLPRPHSGAGVLEARLGDFAVRAGDEGFERLSGWGRRSSTSPRTREITTESRPAATSPAALAWLTTPTWSPIWVAGSMAVRDVDWSAPAITERERPSSRTYTIAG